MFLMGLHSWLYLVNPKLEVGANIREATGYQ